MTPALSTTPRIRHIAMLYLGKPCHLFASDLCDKEQVKAWSSSSAPPCFSCLFLYWVGGEEINKFRNPTVILECVRHINPPLMSVKHQMHSFSCVSWFLWAVIMHRETKTVALCVRCPYRPVQISLQVSIACVTARYTRKHFFLLYLGSKQYGIFTKLEGFKKLVCGSPDFVLLLLTFYTP